MKIPVFVSSPTSLSEDQNKVRQRIIDYLDRLNLEQRALGRSDYPTEYPLREVHVIAKHCSGGLILGFEQTRITGKVIRLDNAEKNNKKEEDQTISIPTPWNHLEAGIMFGLRLPMLIFKEHNVSGGVFDNGVTDIFVHKLPTNDQWSDKDDTQLKEVFLKWYAKVSEHYYA